MTLAGNSPRRIMVIDDSAVTLKMIDTLLRVSGYETITFQDGRAAVAAVRERSPDLVLCDIQMPTMDGFEVLTAIREIDPFLRVIMVTSTTDLSMVLRTIRLGAFDYVMKPVDMELLREAIGRALRMSDLEAANRRYHEELARREQRNQNEMALAKTIIGDLLPQRMPGTPGLEFGLAFLPSSGIGGDYYDFVQYREPNRLGVVIADISGHGVPAALLLTMFKMRAAEVFRSSLHPAESLAVLNRTLARDFPADHFASTFYVVFNTEARELTYSKASSEPALLLRRDGGTIFLDRGSGFALGAFDPEVFGEPTYTQHMVSIEPGDTLLLFTDGLVEIHDRSGHMLRIEGLLKWIEEDRALPPQQLVDRIIEKARSFIEGETGFDDDVTLLAVRFAG